MFKNRLSTIQSKFIDVLHLVLAVWREKVQKTVVSEILFAKQKLTKKQHRKNKNQENNTYKQTNNKKKIKKPHENSKLLVYSKESKRPIKTGMAS